MPAFPNIHLRCGPSTDLAEWHPDTVAFYGYWLRISPPGTLPGRQHFDPVDLGRLLSRVSLYEVSRDPVRYRCRVLCRRSVEVLGIDLTGRFIDECVKDSSASALWMADMEEVVVEQVPIYRKRRSRLRPELDTLLAEAISVPLARDGKNVDMIASHVLWSLDHLGQVL